MLAAFIGPLFGILLVDFYRVRKQVIDIPALYSDRPGDTYWYDNGVNRRAVWALVPAVIVGVIITLSGVKVLADFNWFIGCALGGLFYRVAMKEAIAAAPKMVAAAG